MDKMMSPMAVPNREGFIRTRVLHELSVNNILG